MTDLAEFLLDRIAQDSFLAFHSQDDEALLGPVWEPLDRADHRRPHAANWTPTRVLAECEAKRRIVEECKYGVERQTDAWHFAQRQLRLLALPYASHPEYDPAWRT